MARKTEFEFTDAHNRMTGSKVTIQQDTAPYIEIHNPSGRSSLFMDGSDLERFAVNILKALGSKKLGNNNNHPYPDAEGQGA